MSNNSIELVAKHRNLIMGGGMPFYSIGDAPEGFREDWLKYVDYFGEAANMSRSMIVVDGKPQIRGTEYVFNGEKISKGLKEYYQNPENKEKISKGLKEYYKNNKHKPKPKLVSESTVKEIRTKYSTGNYSKSDLSREYNLSWGTIKNIVDSINSYKNVGNK
jgi:hypothetical protein